MLTLRFAWVRKINKLNVHFKKIYILIFSVQMVVVVVNLGINKLRRQYNKTSILIFIITILLSYIFMTSLIIYIYVYIWWQ